MASKSGARLRDTSGATILMALVALLVAAMVVTTILAAANSTVRQAKADQQLQQDTLSLQSAGSFVSDDISGDFKVVARRSAKSEKTQSGTWSDPSYGDWTFKTEGRSYFSDQLLKAVKKTYPDGPSSGGLALVPAEGGADITAAFKDSAKGIDSVQSVRARFTMSCKDLDLAAGVKENKLVFVFEPASASAAGTGSSAQAVVRPQTLYLTFDTNVDNPQQTIAWDNQSADSDVRTGVVTCVYSWTRAGFSTSEEG